MAKDPAFLFYYQDFLVGTDDMSLQELGAYIRCLCHQASKGGLTDSHMRKICETSEIHMCVISKFSARPDGTFFNERLQFEVDKRKAFTASRSANRSKPNNSLSHMKNTSVSYVQHMENENEIEDEDVKGKRKKEKEPEPELVFPYCSTEFMSAWQNLLTLPKWKKKKYLPLQAALKKLSEVSEKDAITAIMDAISGDYQGIFPEKYKNNGHNKNREPRDSRQVAAEAIDFIRKKRAAEANATGGGTQN